MNFKKIISTALAGVMALSLTATALAADNTTTLEIPGEVVTPTIKVVVPAADGKVLLNPYKLTAELKPETSSGAGDAVTTTEQVISRVQYLANKSDVAINVGYTVTGNVATGVTLATAPIASSTKAVTTKSAFVYVQMQACDKNDGTADPTWTNYDASDKTIKDKVTVVGTKAATATKPVVLAAADWSSYDDTDSDPDSTISVAATGGYAAIVVKGDAASSPTTAWGAADTIGVNFAFTFTPTVVTAP